MPDAYGFTDADNQAYAERRRKVSTDLSAQLANNAYGRFVSQQRFQRHNQAATADWQRKRNRLPGGFMSRGISMNSPLWQGALRNFAAQRTMAENADAAEASAALGQYDLNDADVRMQAADALTSLEEQRQARIRDYLASLAAAAQFRTQ